MKTDRDERIGPTDPAVELFWRMRMLCHGEQSTHVIEAVAGLLSHIPRVLAKPGHEEKVFEEVVRTARVALREMVKKGMN